MEEFKSSYESCLEVCGNLDRPGLALDMPLWVDHTKDDTTVDQARIETELVKQDLTGRNILHVGIGNSQFAWRFSARASLIDGLTVSENEKMLGDSLGIGNYTIYFLNKYGREFMSRISNKYDFIIDNNLASFACCKYHFYSMLDNYIWSSRPQAQILTDQRGMDWVIEDERWKLTYQDLLGLEKKFPVRASRVTDTVFSIQVAK
ncbi:MAG TPA: hypothetical protein VEZ90_16310 [Blastocatellia bacterium]|nr:hypothetical protein [Blastocatellia bacterium]